MWIVEEMQLTTQSPTSIIQKGKYLNFADVFLAFYFWEDKIYVRYVTFVDCAYNELLSRLSQFVESIMTYALVDEFIDFST